VPPNVMTMEMTDAKMGRSIQKWEMFMVAGAHSVAVALCSPDWRAKF
jgi:hypothetical protein